MHGSLLPKYRGRAPVNWAIVHGETRDWRDAALHAGEAGRRPCGGSRGVAIGSTTPRCRSAKRSRPPPRRLLARCLPALLAGTAPREPLDLAAGSYYGRRRPEDGAIDWAWPAAESTTWCGPWPRHFPAPSPISRAANCGCCGSRNDRQPSRHPARAPCLYAEGDSAPVRLRRRQALDCDAGGTGWPALTAANLASRCGAAIVPLTTWTKS